MATPLRRIEKEFILTTARDEKTKLLLIAGSGEWPVQLASLTSDSLTFTHSMPLRLLRRGADYEFRFAHREQAMAFHARALEARENQIVTGMPDKMFKDLRRQYSRRSPPADFAAAFSFRGDRYELSFPKGNEFDPVEEPRRSKSFDPADIRQLVHDFNLKAEEYASERAILMFKERKPEKPEERIIVRTGRIFYLPSAAGGLPAVDPYIRPRMVTREQFGEWLREEGTREELVEAEILRFERGLREEGILSALLVPILFQEYVIGCVSLLNRLQGKEPFDLGVLEKFQEFAKVLAYSLKINGYFRGAPKKRSDVPAEVIDVSASGILFANPSRELATSLLHDSILDVQIKAGDRIVKSKAVVKRSYRDTERVYFGLEYREMAPEDFRFLFEKLYGHSFTDADALGVEGLGVAPAPTASPEPPVIT